MLVPTTPATVTTIGLVAVSLPTGSRHLTAVSDDHETVRQMVVPTAEVGVLSVPAKFMPVMVADEPPVRGPFATRVPERTGESKVNEGNDVPSTVPTWRLACRNAPTDGA